MGNSDEPISRITETITLFKGGSIERHSVMLREPILLSIVIAVIAIALLVWVWRSRRKKDVSEVVMVAKRSTVIGVLLILFVQFLSYILISNKVDNYYLDLSGSLLRLETKVERLIEASDSSLIDRKTETEAIMKSGFGTPPKVEEIEGK